MALELVTPLPPGAPSHTRLAKHGARLVVLREIKDGTDCSWPPASPSMVTLQEVGELQGKRHALFPWVPGVTLRELVKALELVGKPAPIGLVGRVLVDAARALAAITPARAHGGVNDGSMQIGFDGQVSVLDFGAPRTSRFRPIGRVNFAADVFALGGVLHAMLTGFQGDYASPPATLASPSTSHAEATSAIDDVVLRALSPQADTRQASAEAFGDELEAVLGDQLFTHEQVAEVVTTLFKERIKLLHSLGGLLEEQPSLEAVLPSERSSPLAPIPSGTQPGIGGARPDPPSEPTLPRIGVHELRTDTRIPIPPAARSMVPWESGDGLSPAPHARVAPRATPTEPLDPRPSQPSTPVEPDTNPRAVAPTSKRPADTDETSGLRMGSPADTDESSAPREELRPRSRAPRALSAEEEHSPTRPGGPRALSRSDVEARPADSDSDVGAKTIASDLPEDTTPRARLPEESRPRATAARPAVHDDPADTGPLPAMPPRPRNTTEGERQRALGQERLRTPPQGVQVSDAEEEELRNEPTEVRKKIDPALNAQTAQALKPAPPPASSGAGLRAVMVLLLLVVVGLAAAIVVKLKRQSELPLAPLEELTLEVDAGVAEAPDAGLATAALLVPGLDAGDDEEDEDDAGAPGLVDAGAAEGGNKTVKKPPVKKSVVKKRKKKGKRERLP